MQCTCRCAAKAAQEGVWQMDSKETVEAVVAVNAMTRGEAAQEER